MDYLGGGDGRKLRVHPCQLRYLCITWKVGEQPFNRGLPGLRSALETGPIRRHRHYLLAFRSDFEHHPHSSAISPRSGQVCPTLGSCLTTATSVQNHPDCSPTTIPKRPLMTNRIRTH